MTSTVVLVVSQGTDPSTAVASPSGLPQGNVRFQILDSTSAVVQTQDVSALSASFSGVPDGDFTGTAQLLDTAGALLGSQLTVAFVDGVVVPPAATFQPISALTATVTPDAVAGAAPAVTGS